MTDNTMDNARYTAASAIRECRSHVATLKAARAALRNVFPLDAERLHALDGDTVARLDQFIYRFIKLQDSLGTRLLPAIDRLVRDHVGGSLYQS